MMKHREDMTSVQGAKVLKSATWYIVANFFVKSINYLSLPIFTRILTKDEMGGYQNYLSWLTILTVIITLNLESTFISARFDFAKEFDSYILSVFSLSATSVLIWFVIVNVFFENAEKFFGMRLKHINCLLLYLLFFTAINMFQVRERYYYNYKLSVFISVTLAFGSLVLSVLFVALTQDHLSGRIIGGILPAVLIGSIIIFCLIRQGKEINISYWKYALPICVPYIPHLLSLNVLNSMDRIMITKICGESSTALYGVAYSVGAVVTLFMVSLNTTFSPWLGEKLNQNAHDEIRRISRKYIMVFCIMAVAMMLLSPEILMFYGGTQYMGALYMILPIAMGCVCQFLYTMYVNVEQYKKQTLWMAFSSMAAAFINYILNRTFIPKYGYVAAAYTTLAGYMFLLAAHMLLVKKMGFSNVYDNRFVVVIVGSMMVAALGVNYLYSYNVLRYPLIIVYCIMLFTVMHKYRPLIIRLFRRQ